MTATTTRVKFTPNTETPSEGGLVDGTTQIGNHAIARLVSWKRIGGLQYDFRCSCGWTHDGDGMPGCRTNRAAQLHADSLV